MSQNNSLYYQRNFLSRVLETTPLPYYPYGLSKISYRGYYKPVNGRNTSNNTYTTRATMNTSDTQHIISTITEETPICNKKNSNFLQSETLPTQSALLRNSLIFLVMLTSMTQMYLLGSILSTQAQCGTCKVGTDVVQKTSSTRVSAKQKRRLGTPLKAPTKVIRSTADRKKLSNKPTKKRTSKTRKYTRTKNARTPRTHRLTGI